MQGFLRIAEGIDVLPLRMAVERQEGVFQGKPAVALFDGEEWFGEFYAFPQVRSLLLDVMRRVECGDLKGIAIVKMGEIEAIPALADAACAFVVLVLGEGVLQGIGQVKMGDVIWSAGAFPLHFSSQTNAFSVVVTFAPIP